MLINFSIENFRSIKNKVTLSFEASNSNDLEDYFIINAPNNVRLLKLGLIYGANASGKTTILKGLEFLQDLILEPAEKKTEKRWGKNLGLGKEFEFFEAKSLCQSFWFTPKCEIGT